MHQSSPRPFGPFAPAQCQLSSSQALPTSDVEAFGSPMSPCSYGLGQIGLEANHLDAELSDMELCLVNELATERCPFMPGDRAQRVVGHHPSTL